VPLELGGGRLGHIVLAIVHRGNPGADPRGSAAPVTDPTNAVLLGDTDYAADEDGDAHSSSYDDARQLLFTADEDFCKNSGPDIERGYGCLRIYDFSDPAEPVQIGEHRTPTRWSLPPHPGTRRE
jgi:hypothetical protein